jgi:hypothetical protein
MEKERSGDRKKNVFFFKLLEIKHYLQRNAVCSSDRLSKH